VYLLDYDARGHVVPEMVKKRLVVVVSPRPIDKKRGCVTVVPLSISRPKHEVLFNVPLSKEYPWVKGQPQLWAKCDMIDTASMARLCYVERGDLPQTPGLNHRPVPSISGADLKRIRIGIAEVVGLKDYLDEPYRKGFRAEMRDRIKALLKGRKPEGPKSPPAAT
jgi:uncharacterized protein YifN (PemK superfamily)